MENKLPNTPKGSSKTEVNIAGFSVLLDAVRVFNTRQEQTEKTNKAIQKGLDALIKSQSKQEDRNDSIASKLDALTKSNEKLIDSVDQQTKVVKEDAERAEIAEESIAEKENEKLFLEEIRTRKDEKDRTEIISKLSALEKKDLSVNVDGGSGLLGKLGLLGLMASLLELAAIAGALGLAFNQLKNMLDDLYSGDFFDMTKRRIGEATGAAVGTMAGQAAAKPNAKTTKLAAKGRANIKAATTGKGLPQPPRLTPDMFKPKFDPKTGRFAGTTLPKESALSKVAVRVGTGVQGGVELGKVGAEGLKSTLTTLPSATLGGAAVGGISAGITEAHYGGDAKAVALAAGKGAVEGAGAAALMAGTAGVAQTGLNMVGGRAAAMGTRAIPYIGWALLALDLAKGVYDSGNTRRTSVNAEHLNGLIKDYNDTLERAKKIYSEAEQYKNSDPKRYDQMVNGTNNMIRASAGQMTQYMNFADTENALNEIVPVNKIFEAGPSGLTDTGLWERGSNYNVYDLEYTVREFQKVAGNSAEEKLKTLQDNPELKVPGLEKLIKNVGQEDAIKLLNNSLPIFDRFEVNSNKDKMVYLQEKMDSAAGAAAKIKEANDRILEFSHTRGSFSKFAEGAALIHSKSPMGVPVMAGEQGNPETIIPLKKFDKVISSYLGQKELNLQIEPKSYSDVITNGMRDSYLEEKMQNNGAMTPVIINNNTTTRGGGEGGGTNYQYQTDLSKTYENTFDMILEKNMRLGLP